MDNEKLFELMSKMYLEFTQFRKEVKDDVNSLKDDVSTLKGDVRKLGAKIDGEVSDNIRALQDGYKQNYEMIREIREIVKKNTEDIQDINMSLSEMKEDINFIASKTLRNDSKIDKINEKLKAVK